MKHLTLSTLLMLCAATSAMAEGYQVNTLSAKQQGMGSAGVALHLGAESQLFNPGALAFSDNTFDISGSFTAISAHATATHQGVEYKTDNDISTPMNFAAAFRIYDNFYGGIMFYTPYGSGINWGTHWPGAVLNQKVDIKCFTVQPTLSYQILPNLSIGAGAMITWGNVNLDKGLVWGASMNKLMGALGMPDESMYNPNVTPASVNLKGNSNIAVGFNVGALWDITKQWSVGAAFRSKMTMTVEKGAATVAYSGAAESLLSPVLDNLNSTNFRASLPCPYVFTAGVAYKPIPNLTLAFDAQLNGWGTYKHLDIEFDNLSSFNQHLTKDYKNAMTYHIGAQWGVTHRFDLRAGMMIDTNPCNKDFYNPETPGQTRLAPSVGFSFRPINNFSIDVAFTYLQGLGMDNATGSYDDFVYKMAAQVNPELPEKLGLTPEGTFTADYRVHAFIPAIGLSYSF